MRKARKWVWAPFTNPARKDNAVFHHWKRASDDAKEYPFAQFNKVNYVLTLFVCIQYRETIDQFKIFKVKTLPWNNTSCVDSDRN